MIVLPPRAWRPGAGYIETAPNVDSGGRYVYAVTRD